MTALESAQLTALISMRYPVPAWDDKELALYAELISDLDYPRARAVAMDMMRTCPKRFDVADLRMRYVEAQAQEIDQTIPTAVVGWQQVQRAITRFGRRLPPDDDALHPVVREVAEAIGWESLCASVGVVNDRAHFLKAYPDALGRYMATIAASAGAAAVPERKPVLSQPRASGRLAAPERPSGGDIRQLLADTVRRLERKAMPDVAPLGDEDPDPTPEQIAAREREKARLLRQAEELKGEEP